MKPTIFKISAFVLLFAIMGAGCKKDSTTNTTGKVVFYTNAQAMLNCGPFDVKVYVDNNEVNSISKPYIDDHIPDCVNTTSTIVLEKTVGKHIYTAEMDCGQYGIWTGEFEIKSDNCVYIFLDIKNCSSKLN